MAPPVGSMLPAPRPDGATRATTVYVSTSPLTPFCTPGDIATDMLAPSAGQIDKTGQFSKEAMDCLRKIGLLGLLLPSHRGGLRRGRALSPRLQPSLRRMPQPPMVYLHASIGATIMLAAALRERGRCAHHVDVSRGTPGAADSCSIVIVDTMAIRFQGPTEAELRRPKYHQMTQWRVRNGRASLVPLPERTVFVCRAQLDAGVFACDRLHARGCPLPRHGITSAVWRRSSLSSWTLSTFFTSSPIDIKPLPAEEASVNRVCARAQHRQTEGQDG